MTPNQTISPQNMVLAVLLCMGNNDTLPKLTYYTTFSHTAIKVRGVIFKKGPFHFRPVVITPRHITFSSYKSVSIHWAVSKDHPCGAVKTRLAVNSLHCSVRLVKSVQFCINGLKRVWKSNKCTVRSVQ